MGLATFLMIAATTQTLNQSGFADQRRLLEPKAAPSFEWTTRLKLKAGRSAGVLFGMSDDAQNGYVARLDSRLGLLILGKLGPWPKEERLATFRWEPIDGSTATLKIVAGNGGARVYVKERGNYPLLETRAYKPAGTRIGLYTLDGDAQFNTDSPRTSSAVRRLSAFTPKAGDFKHVYDVTAEPQPNPPTPEMAGKKNWYINDHCLIEGQDGWHMVGITELKPANPMHEFHFAHATAPSLEGPWTKQPFALSRDVEKGENILWAPHIVKKGDTYFMFYCAGSRRSNYDFRIHAATSKDLRNWTRVKQNPLFEDFYDARDPMVLKVGDTYYMYYTANWDTGDTNHIVSVRTSKDLIKWSRARVAFVDSGKGTWGGNTESPYVVPYGDHFYLFIGPGDNYRTTKVYRSPNPYGWSLEDEVATIRSHAAEVAQDRQGKWWITSCGWDADGLYLAPLEWESSP